MRQPLLPQANRPTSSIARCSVRRHRPRRTSQSGAAAAAEGAEELQRLPKVWQVLPLEDGATKTTGATAAAAGRRAGRGERCPERQEEA